MINFISSESINRLHNTISYKGSATVNTKNQSKLFSILEHESNFKNSAFCQKYYLHLSLILIEKTNNILQLQSSI